jgi:hypothetical protein
MSTFENICGDQTPKDPKTKPAFIYTLEVRALEDGKLNVMLLRRSTENASENIWTFLDTIPVEEVKGITDVMNRIAQDARRGAGNVLLASQSFLDKIEIPNGVTTVIADELPDGEAILAYKGTSTTDAGIISFVYGGKTFYVAHPDYKKYIHRLKA